MGEGSARIDCRVMVGGLKLSLPLLNARAVKGTRIRRALAFELKSED